MKRRRQHLSVALAATLLLGWTAAPNMASGQTAPAGFVQGAQAPLRFVPEGRFDTSDAALVKRLPGFQNRYATVNGGDEATRKLAQLADLVARLRHGWPLKTPDRDTYYAGGARGHIDYAPYSPNADAEPDGAHSAA